jgi:hypothetical protein
LAAFGERGGRKPTYLTSATSVITSVKAVSIVTSGGNKTDVHRENADVGLVSTHRRDSLVPQLFTFLSGGKLVLLSLLPGDVELTHLLSR